MPSGAGQDEQEIAGIGPVGMIFVPSIGGISHSPKEFSRPQDIENGANIGRVRWGQAVGPGSDLLVFDRVVAEVDNHRMEAPLEPDEERMQVALGRPC
jgi:hypothetical protein